MNSIVGGILSDCLGAKGIPTGAVSAAIGKLMNKRHTLLREVILCEMRQGSFDRVDEDELISIFFRLIRDAEEGVAKNNLCLMARVINGMAEKKELKASSFLNYANILVGLTEDEVIILGVMVKYKDQNNNLPRITEGGQFDYTDYEEEEMERIIPHFTSIQQSLVRTGLVTFFVRSEEIMGQKKGNTRVMEGVNSKVKYSLTPLMDEILQYTTNLNFDEAA